MLTDEQRKLVTDNINLTYFILRKYHLPLEDNEDLAYIGLCKAAKTYDESRGVKFSAYLTRIILNECLTPVRNKDKTNFMNSMLSLDKTIYEDRNGNTITLGESLKSHYKPNFSFMTKDVLTNLDKFMKRISERDASIFIEHLRGTTQTENASMHNLTQAQISRIVRRLQKRFKLLYYRGMTFDDIIREMEDDMYGT